MVETAVPEIVLTMTPVWVQIFLQVLTLIVAGGISYGITRAKITSHEKDIVALHAKLAQLEKDFHVWQKQRSATVVTEDDCNRVQNACQRTVCGKIETLTNGLSEYMRVADANWKNMAGVIGQFCVKLEITPPKWE